MSLINQLSEAVVGNQTVIEKCPFCGAECRLHHLAEGDRVECLTCKYKSPIDIFALRKHNRVSRIMKSAEAMGRFTEEQMDDPDAFRAYMEACEAVVEAARGGR